MPMPNGTLTIREIYNLLTQKELNLSDFNKIIDLKNQCILEMNQEYLYLCDILIIDIYINEGLLDDALNITLKNLNNIDSIVFKKIHISLLDRVIYLFIHKKNYRSAYRYAFDKRNYLDLDNVDEINRWYLEMAYIYAELNQKDKSLLNLKAILNNYPSEDLKALALSNMTKIYIDQMEISEAKNSLNDCISLVYKLNDAEGIAYCEYLNAKLHILENNYKLAKQSFHDIFKNLNNLTDEYLSIANEYVSLLIELDLYDEAYRISIKYLKSIEKSNDIYIKKDYYKNYLKIYILKNKNVRDDLKQLIKSIDVLEQEIEKADLNLSMETFEDDKNLEVTSKVREIVLNIEKSLNLANLSLKNESLENLLLDFSSNLLEVNKFDEICYVLLTNPKLDFLPDFDDNHDQLQVYSWKDGNLSNNVFSYNNLTSTVLEMIISSNHEIMLDFNESVIPVKNLLTNESYVREGVKSLYAIPMYNDKELFACVLFTSNDTSLTDSKTITYLKLSIKMLESKFVNLFYQDNIKAYKTIYGHLETNFKDGVMFIDPETRRIVLSEKLRKFLNIDSRILNYQEYLKLVSGEDQRIYENSEKFIKNGESYKLEYRIKADNKDVLVKEIATPYITKDGIIKFYVSTLTKLDSENYYSEILENIYGFEDLKNNIIRLQAKTTELNYSAVFLQFNVKYDTDNSKEANIDIFSRIYRLISNKLGDTSFKIDLNNIIVIIEKYNQNQKNQIDIDKSLKSLFQIFDRGFHINEQLYNIETKVAMLKYPNDTYNLDEIVELLSAALETKERFQVMSDEIRKTFLKKKQLYTLISEQIKRDIVELKFTKLTANYLRQAFEVNHHVSNDFETCKLILNDNLINNYETIALKLLIRKVDPDKDCDYYFHISSSTLEELIKSNYFKTLDSKKYQKVVICLSDFNQELVKSFVYLKKIGFRISLNYKNVNSLSLDELLAKEFYGIYLNKNEYLDSKSIAIFSLLDYEILGNNIMEHYQKQINRTTVVMKIDEIN